jgi:aerobic C4-dicarboxylate transport protein
VGAFRFLRVLYVQVLIGIALGITVGAVWPDNGAALKPIADTFIALIKMIIAPVIFCTVVAGIAHMSDLKRLGSVGGKTLIYFEVVSTLALLVGWVVAATFKPGAGMHLDPAAIDTTEVAKYIEQGKQMGSVWDQLIHILTGMVPKSFVSAFTDGNLLQVLLIAIFTGLALGRLGNFGERATTAVEAVGKVFFSIIHLIVQLAPLGAFAAMAFTVGRYGLDSLINLGKLILVFYGTSLFFVLVVLGVVCRLAGFSIFKFLGYIKEELLIVLGTSSSESVLPQLMEKLQRLGASKSVVGLVIPTGYSFNLDGTNIYMTLAILFLAQATNVDLSVVEIITLLAIAMVTSKGASGVTGAGFITLAATLLYVPEIPPAALAAIFGIDRFMSECRALTNLCGNAVAAMVVARWQGELDTDTMHRELASGPGAPRAEPIDSIEDTEVAETD